MKTAKEWFQDLPKDVRKKAFNNTTGEMLEQLHSNLRTALERSFVFVNTPEGHSYWEKISVNS